MKSFKDLEFKSHAVVSGGVHAAITFDNGMFISVVGGSGLYGNGDTSFEVMSTVTERSRFGGVRGWLTKKQVSDHMRYLQKL